MRNNRLFLARVFLLFAYLNVTRVKAQHKDCGSRGWHPYEFQKRTDLELKKALNFTGWSYAGRGQFPWLVEIRKEPQNDFWHQESWSNGNLVTSTFVLTTCKAVALLRQWYVDPVGPIYYQRVIKKDPKEYKVMFSEDYPYKSPGSNTGTREIRQFHVHPNCSTLVWDYHWGVAEVKQPIHPNPPWIGFINLDYDVEGYNMAVDEYCNDGGTNCYIGLWGRKTRSSLSLDLLWNYKIKYIVHPIDPNYCSKNKNLFPWEFRGGPDPANWYCMGIHKNETTAAVCDRDRGAPIVCGGVVRAVLLAGVEESVCNRSEPMPFLVVDIKYAFDMFAELDIRASALSGVRPFGRNPKYFKDEDSAN